MRRAGLAYREIPANFPMSFHGLYGRRVIFFIIYYRLILASRAAFLYFIFITFVRVHYMYEKH